MAKTNFSPTQVISTGWETVKKNLVMFVVVAVGALVLPSLASSLFGDGNGLGRLIEYLLNVAVTLGVAHFAYTSLSSRKLDFNLLTEKLSKYFDMLIASFLFYLAIMVGLILLVIPGIYLLLRLQFFVYYILEKNYNAIDALKASYKLTEGQVMNLLGLLLMQIVVMILGVFALVVGIFVAYPVVMVAQAKAFKVLSKSK